jgi:quercetin dioxygenase-like cupin family protein
VASDQLTKPNHLPTGEGRKLRVITDLVTIKTDAASAPGASCLYVTETPPSGGMPPHVQRYEDETWYVLEGSYTVLLGDDEVALGPGAYVFVPRGTVHAFTNAGATTARMLVLVTPGHIHEQFLAEASDADSRPAWQPDMERVLTVAPKYGVSFLSPIGQTSSH